MAPTVHSYNNQVTFKDDERQKLAENGGDVTYGTLLSPVDTRWTSSMIEPVMFFFLVAKELSDQVITNQLESRVCQVTQGLDMANCTEPLSEEVEDLVQPVTSNIFTSNIAIVTCSRPNQVITNQLESRVCQVTQGLDMANCTEPLSEEVEDLVQPLTATIITARYMIESLLPSFLALLVGPWSDQNGRKPFLVITVTGYALSYFTWAVISFLPQLAPEAFLLSSVPVALSGGFYSIHLLCYCYISDVTDMSSRARRLAFLSLAFKASSIVATTCAPLLLSVQNSINPYAPIFFSSATLILLIGLYIHCCLRETIDIYPIREHRLLVFTHIKKSVSTCFERRPRHGRVILFLLVWTLAIAVSISAGEETTMYLSVRKMFSWKLADYAAYQCFDNIVSGLGAFVGVTILDSWLGLPNMAAAILVLALRVAHNSIMALSSSGAMFYLASSVNVFYLTLAPFCRTELSALVPSDDLGKVFALTAFLESMVPMTSTPLYYIVYQLTYLDNPGTVYWLSAGLAMICAAMLVCAFILQRIGHRRG